MKRVGILLTLLMAACGDSTVYTNANKSPVTSTSESANMGTATITKNAFLFGSDYPARILIPDSGGMQSTAFVVSTSYPAGVVALDLDSTPIQVSSKFKGVVSPSGTGLPNNLVIQSATRGFMLTSSHIIDFNPTTGDVRSLTKIPQSITLPQPMPLSGPLDYDNNGTIDTSITTIPISFPGGIAITGNTVWVSTANYLRYAAPAVAAPGVVFRYTLTDGGLSDPTTTVSSGFNPTGIAVVGTAILVTNSGVLNIVGGEAQPQTASSVDFIDIATGSITASAAADLSALAFFAPMIDSTGHYAYYGSSAFSEVYQLDIAQKKFTRHLLSPIAIGPPNSADYLTAIAPTSDGRHAYVGSFDHSSIYIMDMAASPIVTLDTTYRVGFSKGVTADNPSGVNTGISDFATRPGTSDLYVLTGNPGTLVTIRHKVAKEQAVVTSSLHIGPLLTVLELGQKTTLSGTVTLSDGTQRVNVRNALQWKSDNTAVATVSADGIVTGVGGGITTIRATLDGHTATASIAVHYGAITSVSNPTSATSPTPAPAAPPAAAPVPAPAPESIPAPTPTPPPPPDSGKLIVVTCFATQTLDYKIGAGGGYNEGQLPQIITGPPHGSGAMNGSTDTFSLGAKGTIIVAFQNCRIMDADGPDFIVFENAFYAGGNPAAPFSEPAVVGVSMDGVSFTDFPCDLKNAPSYPGCAGTHPVYANPQNGIDPFDPATAGGDSFDLKTIGVTEARFIRIVDQGLTSFFGANGTNGFDLDAIAVIHAVKPKP